MRRSGSSGRRAGVYALSRAALLATTAAGALALAVPSLAQDATWDGTSNNSWNNPDNWTPAQVPEGIATFDGVTGNSGTVTSVIFTALTDAIGTIRFIAGAPAYTFNLSGRSLEINGTGIVNMSSFAPTIVTGGGIGNVLQFSAFSTAGNAIVNNTPGATTFVEFSTAGSAVITNDGSGLLSFTDMSTAANANITNLAGLTQFFGNSNAGNATIVNNNLSASTTFNGDSSAANAVITNLNGSIIFRDNATAGNATLINDLASVQFRTMQFNNFSTAGNATIITGGGAPFGAAVNFFDMSTAGNATINASNNGRIFFFDNSNAGLAAFNIAATAFLDLAGTTGPAGDGRITAGSLAGAGLFFLGGNRLTVGGNNMSTEVSGVISDGNSNGAGATGASLIKVGTGTLTLSGVNAYTGTTTVNSGMLIVNGSIASSSLLTVNPGGTIGGMGTLPSTTINGGNLSPGTSIGTINIAGNLVMTAAATYIVEVSPSAADRTNVNGTANIAGLLTLVATGGTYQIGRQYVLLNAAGGLSGMFTTGNIAGLFGPAIHATISYDASNVYLNLDPNALTPFLPPGTTVNQRNVAAAIDTILLTGNAPPAFLSLFNLSPEGLLGALSQLSGEIATSASVAAFRSMDLFLAMMLDPFVTTNGGMGQNRAIGFAPEAPTMPEAALAFGPLVTKAPSAGTIAADRDWTVWGGSYAGRETRDGAATVIGSHDLTARVWGFAAGADRRFTSDTVAGVAVTAGTTSFGLSNGLGSGRTEFAKLGVYGSTRYGPAYVSAALAFGWHQASTHRTLTVAGTDTLRGEFNAHNLGARIESGWRTATPWVAVTPYVALVAQSFRLPGYTESATSGAATFALAYTGKTVNSFRSELGAWFDHSHAFDRVSGLTLRTRAAWVHDYSRDPSVNAAFTTLPGASFVVTGAAPGRDLALVSAATDLALGNGMSLTAKFDGEFAKTAQTYSGTATLRRVW